MNPTIVLEKMLHSGSTQEEAIAFFDQLEAVELYEMWGLWKGEEIKTGHPIEGILHAAGWYGKQFLNEEHVHPLMMKTENGVLFPINPAFIPLKIPFDNIPKNLITPAMKLFRPVLKTKNSAARLRQIVYRGKTSAAMVYDKKEIIDIFRKVDANTLMCVMDSKQLQDGKPYFFVLRKVKRM